jgi:hypothetical protein
MTELVFGEVENPDDLNLDPIVVEVVGYTIDHKRESEVFRFRPMAPTWLSMDLARKHSASGQVNEADAGDFLDHCMLEEDRPKWIAFLSRDDLMIEMTTILKVYNAISEVYVARPTTAPSASSGGRARTTRTSRAGARSKASTSTTSP